MKRINIQMEFIISGIEIPRTKNILKENLSRFGIDFSEEDDRLYSIDSDGDKIEIDDNNIAFLSKNCKNFKFIMVKFEKPEKLLMDRYKNNFDAMHVNLEKFPQEKYLINNVDNNIDDIQKLLESFPIIENKTYQYNNIIDYNSFGESIILSNYDSCFKMLLNKYTNDFYNIMNTKSGNKENEIQKFYSYLDDDNFNFLKENFAPYEINHAKDLMLQFHSLFINFNEFKNIEINELLRSIKNNIEKLKLFEFKILEEKIRLNNIKQSLETNKTFFNKLMIEIETHIQYLGFDLTINNFESSKFDNNLSKLFGFIVRLFNDVSSLQKDDKNKLYNLKTDKYVLNNSDEVSGFNKDCLKHKFCLDENCDFRREINKNKVIIQDRIILQNIYKADKIYDV